MAKRTKVFISKKYAKQYIAGVDNGKIIFTEKLGEAWLMYVCEWIDLGIDLKLDTSAFTSHAVTLRR